MRTARNGFEDVTFAVDRKLSFYFNAKCANLELPVPPETELKTENLKRIFLKSF